MKHWCGVTHGKYYVIYIILQNFSREKDLFYQQ